MLPSGAQSCARMLETCITVEEIRKLRQAGRLLLVKEWSAIRLAALVKGKRMTQKEAPFNTFV